MAACAHVALRALAGIGEHDHSRSYLVGSLQYPIEVGMKSAGNDQHRGAKLIERHEHLFGSLRLRHNAHLIFYR